MKHSHSKYSQFWLILGQVLLCFIYPTEASSQTQEKLVNTFQDYSIKNLQEKIYLHLNRNDFLTGEVLWFKIYCTDGMLHRPLDVSRVAYVEILDQDNHAIIQSKVELTNACGNGSLFIPATITSGKYLIRAYTNWMKNYAVEYFFHKRITIVNTLKSNGPTSTVVPQSAIDVQFFPEGGYLIEGIQSRVGFKVLDAYQRGVSSNGSVVDVKGNVVAQFQTFNFGLGSFLFTPQPDQKYKAIIKNSFGELVIEMPEIKKSGYSMMVTDEPDNKIKITVSNPDGILAAHLFVHTRQSIKTYEQKTSPEKSCIFIVDRSSLGDGVSHITIFNQQNEPVCERLYFKKPEKNFIVDTKVDQKEYSIRRKVQLQIDNPQSHSANLSATVFRGDSVASTQNIINYFLLTSDLVGYVESPEFYFSNHPDAATSADNLMLTQGWRRFKWASVLNESTNPIQYLPEVSAHIIQGKILDQNNKPASGKIAYLGAPGGKIDLHISRSDSLGRIQFNMKDFSGSRTIIAQTNYRLDSLNRIEINNPFFNKFQSWSHNPLHLNKRLETELIKRSLGMQVQDAYYEDETYFTYQDVDHDSIAFYGKADETYLLDDFIRFPTLEEVMREFVKGVWIRKKKDEYRFMVIDKLRKEPFKDNPLILLDGVPIFPVKQILDIDPLKIKKLEVVSRKYFYGPLAFSGIVSLITYTNDLGGLTIDPRSVSLNYEGLQNQREFYSPSYNNPSLRDSRMPDERYQLYWNPSIPLAPGGSTQIDFYTGDVEGKFYIIIEGLTDEGMPLYKLDSFLVSR